MKRRQWTSEKKALTVLSGLKGQSVASICNEHGFSQSQYYQGKDGFLANAAKAVVVELNKPAWNAKIKRSKGLWANLRWS